MRMWPVILLAALVVGYFIANNIASVMVLSEIANRPILALTRDSGAVRVLVQTAGQPAKDGEAQFLGGQGILLGHRFGFGMPDASTVICTIRFRSLDCDGGWTAERPAT